MSLGMNAAWRAMQPKKKKCSRCGLYYAEKLDKCRHCGDLDGSGLKLLLDKHEQQLEANAELGKFFILGAVIAAALFLLSFA